MNSYLIQSVVPDYLNSARVVPLFKKSGKKEVGNHRPVSILTIISKVFERVVMIKSNHILFRSNFSIKFLSDFRSRFFYRHVFYPFNRFYYISKGPGSFDGMVLLNLQKRLAQLNIAFFSWPQSRRIQMVSVNSNLWLYLELYPHIQIFRVVFPRDQYSNPMFSIYVNDMSGAVRAWGVF